MQISGLKNKILVFLADTFKRFAELIETRTSLKNITSIEQENENKIPDALEDWLKRTASVRTEEWVGSNKDTNPDLTIYSNEETIRDVFDMQANYQEQKLVTPKINDLESPIIDRKAKTLRTHKKQKNELKADENYVELKSTTEPKRSNLQEVQDLTESDKDTKEKPFDITITGENKNAAKPKLVPLSKRKQDTKETSFILIKTKDKQSAESNSEPKTSVRAKSKKASDFKLHNLHLHRKQSFQTPLSSFKRRKENNNNDSRILNNKSKHNEIDKSVEIKTFNEVNSLNEPIFETPEQKLIGKEVNQFQIKKFDKSRKESKFQNIDSINLPVEKTKIPEDSKLATHFNKKEVKVHENKLKTFEQINGIKYKLNSDSSFETNVCKWIELPEIVEDPAVDSIEKNYIKIQQIELLEQEQFG